MTALPKFAGCGGIHDLGAIPIPRPQHQIRRRAVPIPPHDQAQEVEGVLSEPKHEMPPLLRASHQLCAALHADFIDPSDIEVHLPYDAWWRLMSKAEQYCFGSIPYDGRGILPEQFKFMGITYRVKR
jgi:hypothetical protein